MIIRDNTAKSGDPHEQEKARNNGEELKIDLGRDLTEDEQKIIANIIFYMKANQDGLVSD